MWTFVELVYLRVRVWYRIKRESAAEHAKVLRDVVSLSGGPSPVNAQEFVAQFYQHQLLSAQTRATLSVLRTEKLVNDAWGYGIAVPAPSDSESWVDVGTPPLTRKVLSPQAFAALRKQVLAARRETWESYTKGLVPLIGAITGLAAVLATWHWHTSK